MFHGTIPSVPSYNNFGLSKTLKNYIKEYVNTVYSLGGSFNQSRESVENSLNVFYRKYKANGIWNKIKVLSFFCTSNIDSNILNVRNIKDSLYFSGDPISEDSSVSFGPNDYIRTKNLQNYSITPTNFSLAFSNTVIENGEYTYGYVDGSNVVTLSYDDYLDTIMYGVVNSASENQTFSPQPRIVGMKSNGDLKTLFMDSIGDIYIDNDSTNNPTGSFTKEFYLGSYYNNGNIISNDYTNCRWFLLGEYINDLEFEELVSDVNQLHNDITLV